MLTSTSVPNVARAVLRGALLAAVCAGASSAYAQNAVRGKQLYDNTNNAPISCGFGICHGPDPRINTNKIRDGANDPARILRGITNVPEMRFLSVYVNATDAADIAAYIGNPDAASGAAVTASATAMSFGSTQVGGTSTNATPATITLTNSGAGTLTITAIARSGTNATEFTAGGTCVSASPVAVAPGANCTLTATFRPTATGTRTASFVVQSNAPANPTIGLTGLASATATPDFTRSATSLTFNTQTIGTTSAAQQVTLTSSGMAALTITQVSAAPNPEFSATSNCVGTLAASASCSISVTFAPTASGTRNGTVSITSNVPGSPHTITLSGNGVTTPTPAAALATSALAFGSTSTAAPPVEQGTDLRNTGNAALTITGVSIGGANPADFRFASGHTCAVGTVPAGGNCRIQVEFRPQSAGTKSANVMVTHNATGGSTMLAVSGGATAPAPINQDATTSSALSPSNVGGAGSVQAWHVGLLGLLLLLAGPIRRRAR
jgi:Abnormal spindle-like microcephaly-assoc'd, ASPM-SPD-2-Hydin